MAVQQRAFVLTLAVLVVQYSSEAVNINDTRTIDLPSLRDKSEDGAWDQDVSACVCSCLGAYCGAAAVLDRLGQRGPVQG